MIESKKEGEYVCKYYKGNNGKGLEELLPHALIAYKELCIKYGPENVEHVFIPARHSEDDPLGNMGVVAFKAIP